MSGQPYERDPNAPLTDLSVSRIKVVDKCGLAFKYNYVDRIPAATESASMMFGNIVHDGVDLWYRSGKHTTDPLAPIFVKLWSEYLPKQVWSATERCLAADKDCEALSEAIKIARPTIKAPRQTKDFLESAEHARFEDLREALMSKCDAIEEVRWPKDENPLQAYRKSMIIAEQMQARWQPLPMPLVVEEPFLLKFEGFTIKGRIDQIRQDPDQNGELKPVELLDIKTGKQPLTQMEAFIQAFLYDEACYTNPELPEPDHVTFWLARHNRSQDGRVSRDKHRALALRILNNVARTIITGAWEPHYGSWCRMCDYKELCEEEIGLWPVGEDTLTLEAA